MSKENKSFVTANIESKFHKELKSDAERNNLSITEQIRDYRDHMIALEEKVSNLMSENKMLKERSNN